MNAKTVKISEKSVKSFYIKVYFSPGSIKVRFELPNYYAKCLELSYQLHSTNVLGGPGTSVKLGGKEIKTEMPLHISKFIKSWNSLNVMPMAEEHENPMLFKTDVEENLFVNNMKSQYYLKRLGESSYVDKTIASLKGLGKVKLDTNKRHAPSPHAPSPHALSPHAPSPHKPSKLIYNNNNNTTRDDYIKMIMRELKAIAKARGIDSPEGDQRKKKTWINALLQGGKKQPSKNKGKRSGYNNKWTKEDVMPKNSKKFYAVVRGLHPGIFQTWDECKKSVHGYPGAKFKSFKTEALASEYIRSFSTTSSSSQQTTVQPIVPKIKTKKHLGE
jgi:hypothetical protein